VRVLPYVCSSYETLTRDRVPYTVSKFVVFEKVNEAIYGVVDKNTTSSGMQTVYNLSSGLVAGFAAALISQPADTMLSKINKTKGEPGEGTTSRLIKIAKELGLRGSYAGVGARLFMVGTLTAGQFAIYGDIKKALGATGRYSPCRPCVREMYADFLQVVLKSPRLNKWFRGAGGQYHDRQYDTLNGNVSYSFAYGIDLFVRFVCFRSHCSFDVRLSPVLPARKAGDICVTVGDFATTIDGAGNATQLFTNLSSSLDMLGSWGDMRSKVVGFRAYVD
jgi:hypothetical protein